MELFEILGYTERLRMFDKRIPKTQLFLAGDLSKIERDLLTERVEEVRLSYVINENEHFDSIFWVTVTLRKEVSITKLSRIIQETLPSPTIIVFKLDEKYQFSSALKRLSKNEKGKIVVEEYHHSSWIDLKMLSDVQNNFLTAISLRGKPAIDYKQAYVNIHRQIYKEHNSAIVANIEAQSFDELKRKTEEQLVKQQEIDRLTKLINQKSLSLRDKVELAKRINKLNND